MNANRSRGCINKGHHTSPSDAIALHSADDVCAVPTAFLRKAVIIRKQEFSAWASQASVEELRLSFTAKDKVLLVKHS